MASGRSSILRWLDLVVGLLWLATGAALSTRTYFVFNYSAYSNLPVWLEVLAVGVPALTTLALSLGGLWCLGLLPAAKRPLETSLLNQPSDASLGKQRATREHVSEIRPGIARGSLWGMRTMLCLLAACIPLGISLIRSLSHGPIREPMHVGWWEPILYAVFSGLGVYLADRSSARNVETLSRRVVPIRVPLLVTVCATVACCIWWYWQSQSMFQAFQLGFNDFGHFLLRVIRTSRGQGFLMETPVLPTYWDHFNPGLALVAPLWIIVPSVEMVFVLQAAALGGCSLLIYRIAVDRGASPSSATCWALAWLAYPSIGQMNLAYTYGWHPISFAIPALLAAYWMLEHRRWFWAIGLAILAASFEEGAIAAIGCYAAMQAIRTGWPTRRGNLDAEPTTAPGFSALAWGIVWLVSTIAFLLVYRLSGLATFQTGRFASLGQSAWEILLSPVLKPSVFFELLFRERNGAFLAFLFAPFAVCFTKRPFAWSLLAAAPLMLVLLLWEHMPAQSLAFQYASVILPILFVGAIQSASPSSSGRTSLSVFSTAWILSIFVGQFPWSCDTLTDVKSRSYGPHSHSTRSIGTKDNQVFHGQIMNIRNTGYNQATPFSECRILATGRLAGHFLGAQDLETVGQFRQRREDYRKLSPELESPLLRYDLIVLDPIEEFQQTPQETLGTRQEALVLGYRLVQTPKGFDVLYRPK
ncbi:MAG: DUF2079 domain-containing protein [Planctomycetota bacterium]|nr:DUF2079 domain-containing protein [Planctomycetota bacterium]